MITTSYPSDLTDGGWKIVGAYLRRLLPTYARRTELRRVVNAILYRLRAGCPWRYLPNDFPDWRIVYYYFNSWSKRGVVDEVNRLIVRLSRRVEPSGTGRPRGAEPTALVVDAQTVKSGVRGLRDGLGFDGNKRINGVKRHVLTDTGGRVLACLVEPGGAHEGPRLRELLIYARLEGLAPGGVVFADAGYVGQEADALREGYRLKIVRRTDFAAAKDHKVRSFDPLPKRWIIEQTFGCLSQYRGLRVCHERLARNSEAMFIVGNVNRLISRLTS